MFRTAVVLADVPGPPLADSARLVDMPAGTGKRRCSRERANLAMVFGHPSPGNP